MPGVSVGELRALDLQATRDVGIPAVLLMEHAGLAVVRALRERVGRPPARIVVVAGRGHNGGDGLAAVRLLHAEGIQATVFLIGRRAALQGETALYAGIIERLGTNIREVADESAWAELATATAEAGWIVDALLGIGLRGDIAADAARAIRLMNASGHPILAVDVPSGLDADTGAVSSVAVQAAVTVTFGLPKQGFFLGQGPRYVGELLVDAISFPPALLARDQSA